MDKNRIVWLEDGAESENQFKNIPYKSKCADNCL